MTLIKLFLNLFRIIILNITIKHKTFPKIALLLMELQYFRRYFKQNNIRSSFKPHEKHAIYTFASLTDKVSCFFTLVSTKTILSAWKNYLAKQWSFKRKQGRPPVTKNIKELIYKLKKENILWGTRRIRDELKKLCIDVSHETISKIIRRFRKTGDIKPVLSWKRFLSAHWNSLFACDFFTADIFGLKRFYVFFIIELKSRKIIQYGITENPNIQFLRNQFSVFEYEYPDSYLIHDNSGELCYFPYKDYNIKDVAIMPYSPDMNAYAERFVRSVRQECLDYFIIFTENQLRNIIKSYIEYYNNYRPHQGLKGIPNGSPPQKFTNGEIKQKAVLFGLHNHYYREVA
ncbi:MAG: integrase core domain-containing protein [Treponema sp.]|nr:integrase core domain-containing protein [Treponema sp.]